MYMKERCCLSSRPRSLCISTRWAELAHEAEVGADQTQRSLLWSIVSAVASQNMQVPMWHFVIVCGHVSLLLCYLHTYAYVYIYIYIYMCACIHLSLYMYIYWRCYVTATMQLLMFENQHDWCIYIYIWVYAFMCIYTYI